MKTVGKQLQEARLAKNWTPELAARETKIKVDRLRDLEGDDYSHFTSPTYARGFVRTYARALGLDEYRILRQLDNKLPDDDSANIVTDTGVAYLPETAMPPRVAHRNYAGLYIVVGLGAVVTLAIVFVLFEAYRVGELSRYFGNSPEPVVAGTTNAAPIISTAETDNRAKPVDSSTPPPMVDATNETNGAGATNATAEAAPSPAEPVSPRALPVDSNTPPPMVDATNGTNATAEAAPAATNTIIPPRALPVDASALTNAAAATAVPITPPRALPVNPSDLGAASPSDVPVAPIATTTVALNGTEGTNGVSTPPTPPVAPPAPSAAASARESNSNPVAEPHVAPAAPPADSAPVAPDSDTNSAPPPAPDATTNAAPQTAAPADADSDKRLVLTASQDSFVRVTNLDTPDADKPLYAAVLHSGQSIGFDGRKFSINVGIPSAVDIKLDGVNYGPHSDQEAPETFVVQSHLP
jgi:cytoskeleton protein RodZ